jgi:hypothetical protein
MKSIYQKKKYLLTHPNFEKQYDIYTCDMMKEARMVETNSGISIDLIFVDLQKTLATYCGLGWNIMEK